MPVQEGTAKSAGFIVVNLTPDICRAPTAPIPYNIIAFLSDSFNTSESQGRQVNFQGFPAFNMKSRITRSYGDHPGVGLGLGSAAVQGWCRPITPVNTVKCNETELCRHEYTQFQMNCLGPEGPGNTIGKVIYLGAMLPGAVSPDGALPKSSNAPMWPELPEEPSFLDKIKDSLNIESVKDAVALAQRGYELAQVDWSSPSAALGALAGMAGRAGLGDVATAINFGKKVADSDWSNPSAILKSAAGIAGDAYKLGQSAYNTMFPKEESKTASAPNTNNIVPPSADNSSGTQAKSGTGTSSGSETTDVSSSAGSSIPGDSSVPAVAASTAESPTSSAPTFGTPTAGPQCEAEPWRSQLQKQLEDDQAKMTFKDPTAKVLADGSIDTNEHRNRNDYNWCPDEKPTGTVGGVEWNDKAGLANLYQGNNYHKPLDCTKGQPTDGSLGPGSFECCYDPKSGDLVPNSDRSGTYNFSNGPGFVVPGTNFPLGDHGRYDVATHEADPNYSNVNMTLGQPAPPARATPAPMVPTGDVQRINQQRAQRGLPPLQE